MEFKYKYKIDIDGSPKSRNVFVFMDGTWNDETGLDHDGLITNVRKMYQMLSPDSPVQIKRYFRGVGNDEDNNFVGRMTQGAFGAGEKLIREAAYATICKFYQPGDKFYIFGFSRGAASARMLADDLCQKGIPEEIVIESRPYSNNNTKSIEYHMTKYEALGRSKKVKVEFLGVWDTVFGFGIPMKILGIPFNKYDLLKNKTVKSGIKKAVHLCAIDETREPYQPVLMNQDPENPDRIHEVWFPGVHSDVGGGYIDDYLGRITLNYMLKQLEQYMAANKMGQVQYDQKMKDEYTDLGSLKPVFHFHGLGYKKYPREIYVLGKDNIDKTIKPKIHESMDIIRKSSEVFSHQEKKKLFGVDKVSTMPVRLYIPPNIRALKEKYDTVK